MEKPYHVVENKDTQQWSEVLAKNGQTLLPMVELIEQSKLALDELVDRVGRATIEAVLKLSAEQVAGPPHPGKKGGEIGWHGGGQGTVCLKERKLGVKRPRLRKKKGDGEAGEVSIPAYEAMRREEGLGSRMLEILLRGVSTRQYAKVLPEMAETTGVSRSSVSREAIEASEAQLKQLCERGFEDVDLLIVYVDGVIFGEHHVVVAVGVDREGRKHVLGLAEGASENEVVARGLLEDLVRRGVKPDQKYLFVIDGSKALRGAIDAVFGAKNPVQRCRHHKIENVVGYVSDELKDQVKAVMRAAFRLPKKEGMVKLEKQAEWFDQEYPGAAASLREGLEEMFTINSLGLTPNLARCLASTNIVESSNSGLRLRTRRVCHWQDGKMVLRWAASALLMTEKSFRKIMGYKDLWILESALDRKPSNKVEGQEKVA